MRERGYPVKDEAWSRPIHHGQDISALIGGRNLHRFMSLTGKVAPPTRSEEATDHTDHQSVRYRKQYAKLWGADDVNADELRRLYPAENVRNVHVLSLETSLR
jgi:hypothetical protein